MSDHSISCTIWNQTTGTMVLAGSQKNSGTNLTVADAASSIGPGVKLENAFTAWNNAEVGCGGSVTFTMGNPDNVLVIAYNTSHNYYNSYCTPMLRSSSAELLGCDAYYCAAADSAVDQSDGVTTTITIYEN
jgi:hypothetical protein